MAVDRHFRVERALTVIALNYRTPGFNKWAKAVQDAHNACCEYERIIKLGDLSAMLRFRLNFQKSVLDAHLDRLERILDLPALVVPSIEEKSARRLSR